MKLADYPATDLTYCLNIHPGLSLDQHLESIRTLATDVRDKVPHTAPFGLGLRISGQAAEELADPEKLNALKDTISDNGLYGFTINGFPYGPFHGEAVKQNVYRPDWQDPIRRDYTNALITQLGALLPDHCTAGSISTVPCSYKPWATTDEHRKLMAEHLADCVAHMARTESETGKYIHLGLEPEPDCYLETTSETIDFFEGPIASYAVPHLVTSHGFDEPQAKALINRHLGVCLDTCHIALQFEDLEESYERLTRAGILISKVQISAAIHCDVSPESLAALTAFTDDVYLHQTKVKASDGSITSYPDLPEALAAIDPADWPNAQLRTHFHVPLYFSATGALQSTRENITNRFLKRAAGDGVHLEIETYTFDVLPPELRNLTVTESIANEYEWLTEQIRSS